MTPSMRNMAAGVADGAPGQQVGRDAHSRPAAKTDELAFGEVERHLAS